MITKFLHHLVANPCIYDLAQTAVGAKIIRRRMRARIAQLPLAKCVVDLGGGTGLNRHLWPASTHYICVDMDPLKLSGLRQMHPDTGAVLGDATQVPLCTGCADVVICTLVTHHIPPEPVLRLFHEAFRVLKTQGTFVFFDALWKPRRLPSRFLWHVDRGSYPRTAADLRTLIAAEGHILHWEQFALLHEYVLCLATRRTA
jgi:SAM-dependent methyltransferase